MGEVPETSCPLPSVGQVNDGHWGERLALLQIRLGALDSMRTTQW